MSSGRGQKPNPKSKQNTKTKPKPQGRGTGRGRGRGRGRGTNKKPINKNAQKPKPKPQPIKGKKRPTPHDVTPNEVHHERTNKGKNPDVGIGRDTSRMVKGIENKKKREQERKERELKKQQKMDKISNDKKSKPNDPTLKKQATNTKAAFKEASLVTNRPEEKPSMVGGGGGPKGSSGTYKEAMQAPCGVAGLGPCVGIISQNPNNKKTYYCCHISYGGSTKVTKKQELFVLQRLKKGLGDTFDERTFHVLTSSPTALRTLVVKVLKQQKGTVIDYTNKKYFNCQGFWVAKKDGKIYPFSNDMENGDNLYTWACGNKIGDNGDGLFEVPK